MSAGHFEFVPHVGSPRDISEDHARKLLIGHVRNVNEAIDRMRGNVGGQIAVQNGTVRYLEPRK